MFRTAHARSPTRARDLRNQAGVHNPLRAAIAGFSALLKQALRQVRAWRAIKSIRRIEELIRCPAALVSTSPERDDTILVRDPLAG